MSIIITRHFPGDELLGIPDAWRFETAGDPDGAWGRIYRREAKRGPRWAVYLRHSGKMLSHHAVIWRDIVAAIESATQQEESK